MRSFAWLGVVTLAVPSACAHAPAADDDLADAGVVVPTYDASVEPADASVRPPPSSDAEPGVDAARDAAQPADAAKPDGVAPMDAGSDSALGWGPAPDIAAVMTADNAYGFGWGDANGLTKYTAVAPATLASEIFSCPLGTGPEWFPMAGKDAPPNAYVYVVAWADHATTQGVIGQLAGAMGRTVLTGDPHWQVCATGVEYIAPSAGPTQAMISTQVGACNAGAGDKTTTSGGWVDANGPITPGAVGTLAVGEDNSDNGGAFQIACQSDNGKQGVPATARWMWYSANGGDAFHYVGPGNSTRAFLVFRLPSNAF